MSRRRARAYRSGELSELARQLLYAPPDKRAGVVRQAEQLHDELEPGKNYPIDFLVYRLTGRRVPPSESVMLVGEAVLPDLRLLIDALSRSIEMLPETDDPGETTAELAERLGVSTKTVARWRDAGLRWRWGVREAGGKPTVLIARAALSRFEQQQAGRIDAAKRFARMTAAEKDRLIARARRLADATDAPPQAILNHLARRTGRSAEAVRQFILDHDRHHPGPAVFADRAGPLTPKQRRVIDRAYRRGVGVKAMCERFRKTRSTIYRAIHEARAERALAVELSVIASPTFERDDADEVILRPIKRPGRARRLDPAFIAALPEPLRPFFTHPIDTDAVTRSLVVRYNFLKHRAGQVQEAIRSAPPRAVDLDRFDALREQVRQTRGEVLAGVLPVVLSVVRRQMTSNGPAAQGTLLRMLDAGAEVLLDEIDRFDPSLSHTFESVLTNRLLRVLAQVDKRPCVEADALVSRWVDAGVG